MNFKLFVINILLIFVVFPQSISTTKPVKPIVSIPMNDSEYEAVFIGFEGNGIYKKTQLYAITKKNKLKSLPNFQFILPEDDTNYFTSGHLGDITGEGMKDFVLVLTKNILAGTQPTQDGFLWFWSKTKSAGPGRHFCFLAKTRK